MHLLVRETRSLDAEAAAADLGQSPADLVLLSFSDSDLGAAAAAWEAMGSEERPSLRLASLARLRHPMSVDLYAEQVASRARCVVIRLLGGLEYWRYGAEEVAALCRSEGIALALLPGDGRDDPALRALSTVAPEALARLEACFAQGGPENLRRALLLAAHLGGLRDDPALPALPLPGAGEHSLPAGPDTAWASAAIVFYRSHLQAGDTAPIEALAAALAARGLAVRALYAASLKDPACASFVAGRLRAWRPQIVLNATAFSARRDDGAGSPLDAACVPVLQVVLAGAAREAWAESTRGLSPADLAMHVVLPELDGRLLTTAVSFKAEGAAAPGLEYARTTHRPDADGVALAADRAAGWARLAVAPPGERRVAVVLSDYPGAAGQVAHAVGLDTFASLAAILRLLRDAGYECETPDTADLVAALCHAAPRAVLDLATYRRLFAELPEAAQQQVSAAWGEPEDDPAAADGAFALRHIRLGNLVLAVQPDRGAALDRKAGYHDPDRPPRHAYIAFHLWLRHVTGIHAMLHLGTHGTLEWLPGKAAVLSASCFPALLLGGLPVVYPFIVNNPGEAAVAKRRLGAVTIGHLTPPLRAAGTHGAAADLERLIDEYAAADGLDRRRTALLQQDILDRAEATGLLAESSAGPDMPEDDRLARLDAYLCDVKELQIRDGLHVFGCAPPPEQRAMLLDALLRACPGADEAVLETGLDGSATAERAGLLAALDGRFVAPGPAGAPTRGRADVLPTGRNLFASDPRLVPTPSAVTLAEKAAAELLRRHLQDHGEHPRAIVLDLWGSATMRTGGEGLALALLLLGVRPTWDEGSGRVSGFEVLPIARLDRPRVDVTLRVSGLFRDAFAAQVELFDTAVRAVAGRDEAADWNPLAAACRGFEGDALRRATARIYGPAPGGYGAGVTELLDRGAWQDRAELGASYLAASAAAYGKGLDGAADPEGFAMRVAAADAFVHQQDHREADLLDSTTWAAHEGGFAAAADSLGRTPALYHVDTAHPDAPRIRTLAEEVARVVRGRAANPAWIAGMMRHGYRGAAEIARTVDGLHAFAASLPQRLDRQFDLVFDATLGDAAVDRFLREANPDARAAMAARFQEALSRDLWRCRRNAVADILGGGTP
jgi:cobaltochelatase CobN